MPARTALDIRLDTRPVRWPEEGTQICDPRYDDPHRTPRQNIVVPVGDCPTVCVSGRDPRVRDRVSRAGEDHDRDHIFF
jgi:hypothetical protein